RPGLCQGRHHLVAPLRRGPAQRPAKQPYLLVRLAVAPLPLPQRPRLDAGTHGRLRQGQAAPPRLLRERPPLPAHLGLHPPAPHLPLRATPVPPGLVPAQLARPPDALDVPGLATFARHGGRRSRLRLAGFFLPVPPRLPPAVGPGAAAPGPLPRASV